MDIQIISPVRCQPAAAVDVWNAAAGAAASSFNTANTDIKEHEFDRSKLRGRIIEKYGTAKAFARVIGKTEQTVTAKMTGKSGLSQEDIIEWCNILDIGANEIPIYFFALKLSKS